jgi:ribosomal protein S18 acetylase RimI-like enzyme
VNVTIRTARLQDLSDVHDIRRDAILGIEWGEADADQLRAWAERRPPAYFADRVAAGDVVLAISGSRAVGWGSRSGGHVTGVYIRSSHARTGVGRAIMSHLEADIARRGFPRATLDASPNAVGFYRELGYAAIGDAGADGALPMGKPLRLPSTDDGGTTER